MNWDKIESRNYCNIKLHQHFVGTLNEGITVPIYDVLELRQTFTSDSFIFCSTCFYYFSSYFYFLLVKEQFCSLRMMFGKFSSFRGVTFILVR